MPFIPANQPNPSMVARLGRLLHWLALALSTLLVLMALDAFRTPLPAPRLDGLAVSHGLPWETYLIGSVLVALFGRAVRYLLAGE